MSNTVVAFLLGMVSALVACGAAIPVSSLDALRQTTDDTKLRAAETFQHHCSNVHMYLPGVTETDPPMDKCHQFAGIARAMTNVPDATDLPSGSVNTSTLVSLRHDLRQMNHTMVGLSAVAVQSFITNLYCSFVPGVDDPCSLACYYGTEHEMALYCDFDAKIKSRVANVMLHLDNLLTQETGSIPADAALTHVDITPEASKVDFRYYSVIVADFVDAEMTSAANVASNYQQI